MTELNDMSISWAKCTMEALRAFAIVSDVAIEAIADPAALTVQAVDATVRTLARSSPVMVILCKGQGKRRCVLYAVMNIRHLKKYG